jgi:anti-sigma B factor antagonist
MRATRSPQSRATAGWIRTRKATRQLDNGPALREEKTVAFRTSEQVIEGIDVLECEGRLAFGDEDLQFRKDIDQLFQRGNVNVILDLGGVDEIDTTGLGSLLFCVVKFREAGGRLALADLNPDHLELLVLMRLETVVEVFQNQQDAIDSFFPDREVNHYDILKFVESWRSKTKGDPGTSTDAVSG